MSFITSQGDTAPKQDVEHARAVASFITSQGDTAPKPRLFSALRPTCFITSQGDTAPKPIVKNVRLSIVSLPVRVTLLQNMHRDQLFELRVSLPVRVTLLQNGTLYPLSSP